MPPLTSSSFATDEVLGTRTSRFGAFVRSQHSLEPAELIAYHRQHERMAGAHSVLMRRGDAATRSICHVNVSRRHVRLDYQPIRWEAHGPVMLAPTRMMLTRRNQAGLAA